MAVGDDNVSVKHLWCCGTLLRGRLMRLMRFSVCVNQGSTFELKTTLTEDALGAKAAAEAGSSCGGIEEVFLWYDNRVSRDYMRQGFFREGGDVRCEIVTRAGNTNENSKEQKNNMSVLRRSQNKGISLRALEKE
jgi:hypothetical protein